jgi:chromosome segregation ATPase
LPQLQRERDESKRQLDEVSSQRDSLRLQRQQLVTEIDRAQSHLDTATRQGNIDGMRAARAGLEEIKKTRDELFDLISALSNRHDALQGKYGEAYAQWQRAEGEVEYLTRRIANLRRDLRKAQRREGEYSVYNNNTSPESLDAELRACEGKYFALTGQLFSEQSPAAAA